MHDLLEKKTIFNKKNALKNIFLFINEKQSQKSIMIQLSQDQLNNLNYSAQSNIVILKLDNEPRSKCLSIVLSYRFFIISGLIILSIVTGISLIILYVIKGGYISSINYPDISTTPRTTISGSLSILSSQSDCGISRVRPSIDGSSLNNPNGRIINGQKAVSDSWLWTVSIRYLKGALLSGHVCAGTLIHNEYVVTAAHCVYKYNKDSIMVLIGLNSLNSTPNKNIYSLSDMMYHPEFDVREIQNDIAILKLSRPAEQIYKICIPSNGSMTDVFRKKVVSVGW